MISPHFAINVIVAREDNGGWEGRILARINSKIVVTKKTFSSASEALAFGAESLEKTRVAWDKRVDKYRKEGK